MIGFVIYKLLLTVGLKLRALTALQILDAVFSSVAAVVFFLTLKSAFRSLYLASWLTLLFGLSATWWKYSTDADAYIVSVLLLLIAFRFILPTAKPRPLVVAVFYWLSMCFHELASSLAQSSWQACFINMKAPGRRYAPSRSLHGVFCIDQHGLLLLLSYCHSQHGSSLVHALVGLLLP